MHSCLLTYYLRVPGVFGTDIEIKTQLTPVCVGACPAGSLCPSATHTPKPCTLGTYCPRGSAAGTFCPLGTVGYSTSLTSPKECVTCPLGHFCVGGSASSCTRSTYNPLVGQFLQTACEQCPTNAMTNGTAATSATDCVCTKGYYNYRPANETVACERCPIGSKCIDEGTTLTSLPLVTG